MPKLALNKQTLQKHKFVHVLDLGQAWYARVTEVTDTSCTVLALDIFKPIVFDFEKDADVFLEPATAEQIRTRINATLEKLNANVTEAEQRRDAYNANLNIGLLDFFFA